ncbi:CHAT domain-containing protein [Aphanothece sacrum]|nr:CHAT domain-containing protein [Aphanothece sacrum]
MAVDLTPCLTLAIAPLKTAGSDSFAIWVTHSPLPGGYVHHDCRWSESLTRKWLAWQEMFSPQGEPHFPVTHEVLDSYLPPLTFAFSNPTESYGGQLMQELGINLGKWLFNGPISQSFAQSHGLALGQYRPLRLRLEIREPDLVPLPWEIMQLEVGKQAISLNSQILFSRTTNNVDPLVLPKVEEAVNILLVLGQKVHPCQRILQEVVNKTEAGITLSNILDHSSSNELDLEREAALLAQLIQQSALVAHGLNPPQKFVCVQVHPLIQPTPEQLIETLDTGKYNVIFYAGHGMPAPDGGLLFLGPQAEINGTELAQILIRNKITLAVFNACWGAQPDRYGAKTIERSSLAEVLLHHGVPAVLAMRDSIADREALTFIQSFTKALTQGKPIDEAVRIARQQLLTLYKFNQPAWTLPILYMHPEFDGKLVSPLEDITQLPTVNRSIPPVAYIRYVDRKDYICQIFGGLIRVGRLPGNDLVIPEQWVSQHHAEIICRESGSTQQDNYTYYLRDFSRFGTLISGEEGWQRVHRQEVPLISGTQLQFGSPDGQLFEFVIENFG